MIDINSSESKSVSEVKPPDISKNNFNLDIEKRIIIIENAIQKLKENTSAADEIKDLKESASRLKEIKSKLREMEDLELITKLETIQTQDEVLALTDDISILKGKMELLSSAIKMVGTKISGNSNGPDSDTKMQMNTIDETVRSLKSDIDSLKKRADTKSSDITQKKVAGLELKLNAIASEFKNNISNIERNLKQKDQELKSVSLTLTKKSDTDGSVELDSFRVELNSLRNVIDKVEGLFKVTNDGIKGVEYRLNENDQAMLGRLDNHEKIIEDLRSIDQKVIGIIDSKIKHIKTDIFRSLLDAGKDEGRKVQKDITACKDETNCLKEKIRFLDDIKRKVEELSDKDTTHSQRISTLEQNVTSLKELKNKIDEFEKQISVLAEKETKTPYINEITNMPKESDSGYMKYVPVLKENVIKLYHVYDRAEKRITDMEKSIIDIKTEKSTQPGFSTSTPSNIDDNIKAIIDSELLDVIDNINALNADIKLHMETETKKQNSLIDDLRRDNEAKISTMRDELETMINKKDTSKPYNYEEFAEFKARSLSEIDELRRNMKDFEQKLSADILENVVDNKLVTHISNQDKIANSLALLNRKVEHNHVDLSKNTHEKINRSVKPLVERVTQIESDVNLLKDMRADIVDDVTMILERIEEKSSESGIAKNDTKRKNDDRLSNLEEKIEMILSKSATPDGLLDERFRSLHDENEVLRHELNKIKSLYFDILEREKDAPIIIE